MRPCFGPCTRCQHEQRVSHEHEGMHVNAGKRNISSTLGAGSTVTSCRAAAIGVYDPEFPRPAPGQSGPSGFHDAAKRGLLLSQVAPAAWESSDPSRRPDNTGNLVWSFAAWNLLATRSARVLDFSRRRILESGRTEAQRFCQLYVASGPLLTTSAPAPHEVMRFTMVLDAVRQIRQPLVVLGVGVIPASCTGQLHQTNVDFLSELERRMRANGGFVGLRGECTARLVRNAGFTKERGFEALGCPSLFLNSQPDLGATLERKYARLRQRILDGTPLKVAITIPSTRSSLTRPIVRFWAQHHHGSIHVMQDLGDPSHVQRAMRELVRASSAEPEASGRLQAAANASRNASIFFYDAREWRDAMAAFDVVVGPRIHGAMIALAAGWRTQSSNSGPSPRRQRRLLSKTLSSFCSGRRRCSSRPTFASESCAR